MALFQSDQGTVEVADPLVRAVAQNAAFAADLTIAVLRATGLLAQPVRFPSGFLLELAAVLQIGHWERQGLTLHRISGLPTFREASQTLAERAAQGAKAFEGDAHALSRAVMAFWVENFAWEGRPLLCADITVGTIEEDQFADLLAEFLWSNRDQLSHLLESEESQHAE